MSGRTGKFGNPEWEKTKYKTGKIIFSNATKQDIKWTPNGQNVTLTIGTKKVTLKPGERYAYQPNDNETLHVKAKPQLSTMGSRYDLIKSPLSYDDHHIWIWAGGAGSDTPRDEAGRPIPGGGPPSFNLKFWMTTRGPPH